MRLTDPVYLALLLLLAPLYRRHAASWRMHAATVTLLVLALAGPELAGATRRHLVVLVDRSDSVLPPDWTRAYATIATALASLDDDDQFSAVIFGADAVVASQGRTFDGNALTLPDTSATDIATALRTGGSLAGRNGRLVLFSDGYETSGNAVAAAGELRRLGVALDVVPLGSSERLPEVLIEAFDAPAAIRRGSVLNTGVVVRSTRAGRATLVLRNGDETVARRDVALEAAGSTRVALSFQPARTGMHTLVATIEADEDTFAGNNEARAIVSVTGPAQVLFVSQRSASSLQALAARVGMSVSRVQPGALAEQVTGLEAYDAVVLENLPAAALSESRQRALAQYVERRGGGLVAAGGAASFGPGGWIGTPVAALLPVEMRPPARSDANAQALTLLIDKSGSMAALEHGVRRIDVAVRAAAPLVDVFAESGRLSVVAFDAAVTPVVTFGESASPAELLERMRRVDAGGGTVVAPALEQAYAALLRLPARSRHVILLSDGQSAAADLARARAIVERGGVTLSTVGVGDDVNREFLAGLANAGAGRSYFAESVDDLPRIFEQEVSAASGDWTREATFEPTLGNHPAALGLGRLPAVRGYVITALRPAASAAALALDGDPLVAAWPRGLGRAAAVTTDVGTSWAADLAGSAEFATLWAAILEWTARPLASDLLRPAVRLDGATVDLTLDALSPTGEFVNGLTVTATIDAREGLRELPLAQVSPGTYAGGPQRVGPGDYTVRFIATDPSGRQATVVTAFAVSTTPERQRVGVNTTLLEGIARESGGRMLAEGDALPQPPEQTAWTPLRSWLVVASLLTFLLHVAVQRGVVRAAWLGTQA